MPARGQSHRFMAAGDQPDLLTGQGAAAQLDHHVSVADHQRRQCRVIGVLSLNERGRAVLDVFRP